MATSLVASAGWVVSHWFYRIDRARWRALPEATRADAIAEAQTWLAASDDPAAAVSGGYWHHRQQQKPAAEVLDPDFQDQLTAKLAELTGVSLF